MTPDLTELTHAQLCDWLDPIVNSAFFDSRGCLTALLAENATKDALEKEFREFFEGYCGLAFSLEDYEKSLLSILETHDEFALMKYRVKTIEANRKTSPLGRRARREGMAAIGDPVPQKKVTLFSAEEFRGFIQTLASLPLFVSRDRVIKLMQDEKIEYGNFPLQVQGKGVRLSLLHLAFLDFFVCYLEFEQFLEDYDYDPDEGFELRPEFAAELDQRVAEFEAGKVEMIPFEDIFKELERD